VPVLGCERPDLRDIGRDVLEPEPLH